MISGRSNMFFVKENLCFWERVQAWVGRGEIGGGRDTENPKQAHVIRTESNTTGAQFYEPCDHDLNWNKELDTWLTEALMHPEREIVLINIITRGTIDTWSNIDEA